MPGPGLHLPLELYSSRSLRPSVWPQVPTTNFCALQPGASWIADCTRHHCSNTPLGAVLVRSPISCPPLNETECAKVSASLLPLLPLQHSLRPGALAVLFVRGRGEGPVWRGVGGGFPRSLCACPATPTSHLSMHICSNHITPHILTRHVATQMQASVYCHVY